MKATAPKSVAMVAGEPSGDLHGAHLIQALRRRHGDCAVWGAGGQAMQKAGAHIVVDIRQLSVMGFTGVLARTPHILKALSRLKHQLLHHKPDLLILIDFPDFNLHLAGYAKKLGIPVLYYISPTVWAWRSNRVRKIKRRVDHMAVILPFEKPIYEKHRVPVSYVGHPLMDMAPQKNEATRAKPSDPNPAIAILPGSRVGEIKRLLPEMLHAARLLQAQDPQLRFEISRAPGVDGDLIDSMVKPLAPAHTRVVSEPVNAIFERCCLAIVASGTASLEAAIFGIPTIIVYAVSDLNYWLGKLLVNVPHIGLANLIAHKRVLPELVQKDATAPKIAAQAHHLLHDAAAYGTMQQALKDIRLKLGQAGAADRVARIACRLMRCDCVV
jgi:lipid-A-disaccharide synthase